MILQNTRSAAHALRVNKLRSALTMLGVVIGVGAIIAMVAVGSGAHARVAEQIQSLGSNLLIVISGSVTVRGVRGGGGAAPPSQRTTPTRSSERSRPCRRQRRPWAA